MADRDMWDLLVWLYAPGWSICHQGRQWAAYGPKGAVAYGSSVRGANPDPITDLVESISTSASGQQSRGPDGRLVSVDEIRHIKPIDPFTDEALAAASVPWSPGPAEYAAHLANELAEAMGLTVEHSSNYLLGALNDETLAIKEMGISLEDVAQVFNLTPDQVRDLAPPPLD